MTRAVSVAMAVLIFPAFLLGFTKMYRRLATPELRYISTPPNDYFSLIALQAFFFSGLMVLLVGTPGWTMTYFLVTSAFLFYVPFSKISHYVYYLTGARYGWRGVVLEKR